MKVPYNFLFHAVLLLFNFILLLNFSILLCFPIGYYVNLIAILSPVKYIIENSIENKCNFLVMEIAHCITV